MKKPPLFSLVAILIFAASGCDKKPSEIERKISELERQNQEAAERQRVLEQQLEDQKLAAERDAIERERARIEADRAELERQKGQAAAEQDEALRQREEDVARREGRLEQVREVLDEKENQLGDYDQQLSERDRELAGREALDFESTEQTAPVGDYGTFYESLSPYGSWYETADYGYVWQPAVVREDNWRPYSRGRWACSDRGWAWMSDEPFGWATYHYGRWARISGRGWVWVPGTEWAPCWVSWRESDSHIGWAPLPPETMAYRGRGCDSTVDVRFAISAICFNFVEIRHFGGPLFRHCLPVAGNGVWFGQSLNITRIHFKNRQVICGGPAYQKINGRIGGAIPFYRLELDHHPRLDRNQLALRPQVRGGKLRVSAPNMDAEWNAGLKPREIRGRIESVRVERQGDLETGVSDHFRQTREEERQRAEQAIAGLGGRERFDEVRGDRLRENRIEAEGKTPSDETRVAENRPGRQGGGRAENREGLRVPEVAAPDPMPEGMTRREERQTEPEADADSRREVERRDGRPRVLPTDPEPRGDNTDVRPNRRQEEDAANAERENANRRQREQQEAEQARQARNEEVRREREEQARRNEQQEKRQAEQARQQALAEQREQARQQQEREQEQARRQEREMQRQQEEARQRQQEQAERQQEENRQRQREQEQSRQREQEQARQQQKQKDDDERSKRNR